MHFFNEEPFSTSMDSTTININNRKNNPIVFDDLDDFDFTSFLNEEKWSGDGNLLDFDFTPKIEYDITPKIENDLSPKIEYGYDITPKIEYEYDFTPKIEYGQSYSNYTESLNTGDRKPSLPRSPLFISSPVPIPGKEMPYRNTILNKYDNPTMALHIIDQFKIPEHIHAALEAGLKYKTEEAHKRANLDQERENKQVLENYERNLAMVQNKPPFQGPNNHREIPRSTASQSRSGYQGPNDQQQFPRSTTSQSRHHYQGPNGLHEIPQSMASQIRPNYQESKQDPRLKASQSNLQYQGPNNTRDIPRSTAPQGPNNQLEIPRSITSQSRPQNQESNDQLEILQSTAQSSNTSTPGTRNPKNRRSENIAKIKPENYYHPLPAIPMPWGYDNKGNGPIFTYNAYGELEPQRRYTVDELTKYLLYHYSYWQTQLGYCPKAADLTLWIQSYPADSEKRRPTRLSTKCRFENCPARNGTIQKGEYRVTFDEFAGKNMNLDPFHNAGYVHLFCLEKNFDFPKLSRKLNFRPDTRKLQEQLNNPMAINRTPTTGKPLDEVCEDYMAKQPSWESRGGMPANWFKESLTYALTYGHSKDLAPSLKVKRANAEGNHIEKHWGDLDQQHEYRNATDERKKEMLEEAGPVVVRERKRTRRKRKTMAPVADETDESGFDYVPIKDEVEDVPQPSKRARRSEFNMASSSSYSPHLGGMIPGFRY